MNFRRYTFSFHFYFRSKVRNVFVANELSFSRYDETFEEVEAPCMPVEFFSDDPNDVKQGAELWSFHGVLKKDSPSSLARG